MYVVHILSFLALSILSFTVTIVIFVICLQGAFIFYVYWGIYVTMACHCTVALTSHKYNCFVYMKLESEI